MLASQEAQLQTSLPHLPAQQGALFLDRRLLKQCGMQEHVFFTHGINELNLLRQTD